MSAFVGPLRPKLLKKISLLGLLVALLVACQDSNPGPSLRTAESRLKGEWRLKSYQIRNLPAQDSLTPQFRQGRYVFLKPEETEEAPNLKIIRSHGGEEIQYLGFWNFANPEKDSLCLRLTRQVVRFQDANGEMITVEDSPYRDTTTLIGAKGRVWGIEVLKNNRLQLLLWEEKLELETY